MSTQTILHQTELAWDSIAIIMYVKLGKKWSSPQEVCFDYDRVCHQDPGLLSRIHVG